MVGISRLCLYLLAGLLFVAGPAFADLFDFRDNVDQGSLKPFTRDLGGMLGSSAFHSGRPLGFSGFDLGVHGGIQLNPEPGDEILRRSGVRSFGLPLVQAEIGLPFKFDGFIRGASYQGLTVAGGGLRYGLFKVSDEPWKPQVLISGVANSVSHEDFAASHYGFSLVGSLNFPLVTPYVGAGIDRTRVIVRTATNDPSLVGATATTAEPRFTVGATVKPIPFGYLHAAFVQAHKQPGFEAGFGARF